MLNPLHIVRSIFHDKRLLLPREEPHKRGGDLLKAVVFGGLDGILTSFAIIAGATGGDLSVKIVLILGFSNIFADALSMGVGEYLSSVAHNDWVLAERKRETWEVDNYPDGEIEEMVDIYVERGMSLEDARKVIGLMSKYKDFFIDVMMVEELGLQVPEDGHRFESLKEGIVMFCAFSLFGSMPLLGYVIIPIFLPHLPNETMFSCSCFITGFFLFLLGSIKCSFSTTHWALAGMETLFLGGTCGALAHLIGGEMSILLKI